jgi:hypothetical protein
VSAQVPGYDWYKPKDWDKKEWVTGKFQVDIPGRLPRGEYSLIFAVMDEGRGDVLAALDASGEPLDGPHVYIPGEWNTGKTITVVTPKRAKSEAEADWDLALAATNDDQCEEAWTHYKNATRHIYYQETWAESHGVELSTEIAGCLVDRARGMEEVDEKAETLVVARKWDRHHDELLVEARALAASLDEQGDASFAEEEWEEAYEAYAAAMALDPRLSWTRRKAEDARDLKLDIIRPDRREKRPKKVESVDKSEAKPKERGSTKNKADAKQKSERDRLKAPRPRGRPGPGKGKQNLGDGRLPQRNDKNRPKPPPPPRK